MIYTIIGVLIYAFFDSWLHGAIGRMLNNMTYKNEKRAKAYKATFHTVGAVARIGAFVIVSNYFGWVWYWSLWSGYTIWLFHEIFFKADGTFISLKTNVTCEKWRDNKTLLEWLLYGDWSDCLLVKLRDKTGIHLHYISFPVYMGLCIYIGFQL